MPASAPLQPPKSVAPYFAGSFNKYTGSNLQRAGNYTLYQIKAFWDNILHLDALKASTKISREVLLGRQINNTQNVIFASAKGIDKQICLDSFLSRNFFSNQLTRNFGTITYYLEKKWDVFCVLTLFKID